MSKNGTSLGSWGADFGKGRRGLGGYLQEAAAIVVVLDIIVAEEGGDAGGFTGLALGFEAGLFVEEGNVFFVRIVSGVPWLRFWDIARLRRPWRRRLKFLQRTRGRRIGIIYACRPGFGPLAAARLAARLEG